MDKVIHPVRGLAYYLSSPDTLVTLVNDPHHAIVYIFVHFDILCSIFKNLDRVSGSSPKDVANNLKEQNITAMG